MAISDSEWNQTTDPFIMASTMELGAATGYAPSGIGTSGEIPFHIEYLAPEGVINLTHSDPDIQEVYLQNQANQAEVQEVLSCMLLNGTGVGAWNDYSAGSGIEFRGEIPPFKISDASWNNQMTVIDHIGAADPTDIKFWVVTNIDGSAPGGVTGKWKVMIFTALCWDNKDPAQIATSWLIHYPSSGHTLMRSVLDKDSFQSLADYFDDYPCKVDTYRVAGRSVAEQCKALFAQSRVLAGINQRGKFVVGNWDVLDAATLTLDPTDATMQISDWTSRVDRDHRLGTAVLNYGRYIAANVYWYRDAFLNPDSRRPDMPVSLNMHINTGQNGENADTDCSDIMRRSHLARQWDLFSLAKPHRTVTLEQGPVNLAYDVCQQIPVVDEHTGLTTSDRCIVHKKKINLDDYHATVEIRELPAVVGVRPLEVPNAITVYWLRTATNGKYNHDQELPGVMSDCDARWHLWPFNRGDVTPGGGGDIQMRGSLMDYEGGPNGWPCANNGWLDTQVGTFTDDEAFWHGYQGDATIGGPDYYNKYFYFTIVLYHNGASAHHTGSETLLDAQNSGGNQFAVVLDGNPGAYLAAYVNTTFYNSTYLKSSLYGGWHVVTVGNDGTNFKFWVDGSNVSNVAYAGTVDVSDQIGILTGYGGGGSNSANIRWTEMILQYDNGSGISASDIVSLHEHLMDGYGI